MLDPPRRSSEPQVSPPPPHAMLQGCAEEALSAAVLRQGYRWLPSQLQVAEQTESLLSLTAHTTCWQPEATDAFREVGAGAGVVGGAAGLPLALQRSVRWGGGGSGWGGCWAAPGSAAPPA